MKKLSLYIIATLFLVQEGCKQKPFTIPIPGASKTNITFPQLTRDEYRDKILGAIVGSAIGDAMGAPTEMWHRRDIQKSFGFITGLTPAIREKSPEGIWRHNMESGATTDDTRWKFLLSQYFSNYKDQLSSSNFSNFILDYYQNEVRQLSDQNSMHSTDILDEKLDKVQWIKEWARVAMAYREGVDEYNVAQNRFYGGEMSCAGILYTPMIGLINNDPEASYLMAYEHAIFDIGYAKDISALVAVMTTFALYNSDMDDILESSFLTDPYEYSDSRLIGRLSKSIASESIKIVGESVNNTHLDTSATQPPTTFKGSKLEWLQLEQIFLELENRQKAIAFHAGEIWQIMIASLAFGNEDFLKTMTFIINYGRDNDTVAAAVGFILGAKIGYSNLPIEMKNTILDVSNRVIGIDLEQIADEVVVMTY